MKRILLLFVVSLLASCSEPVDPREQFNLVEAQAGWNTEQMTWTEMELRQLEYGRHSYNSFCAACHLSSGEGQQAMGAPALKGNPYVRGDVNRLASKVLFGSKQRSPMPAFARSLDDEQLAAILSYLRNAWGEQSGEQVSVATVSEVRQAGKSP